jgi:predicted RNase H-like HicB family nuclease
MFVIKEVVTGVTTQGKTFEEAIDNLKEAVELYLEEMPEVIEELKNRKTLGAISRRNCLSFLEREVAKILVRNFGFEVCKQKGNHNNVRIFYLFFFLIRTNFPIYLSSPLSLS